MNEIKTFTKNENDNWEEYKDLINEDTKFMMFDGENAKELSVSETIHQLRLDNKYLELQIINLQSKIDKTIKILKYDGIVEDIFYALGMLFEISDYFDDETMIPKELRNILKEDK